MNNNEWLCSKNNGFLILKSEIKPNNKIRLLFHLAAYLNNLEYFYFLILSNFNFLLSFLIILSDKVFALIRFFDERINNMQSITKMMNSFQHVFSFNLDRKYTFLENIKKKEIKDLLSLTFYSNGKIIWYSS